MSLANLAKNAQLKEEPFDQKEFLGLFNSGKLRLKDACNTTLFPDSRFDLAYNAAHSLALAALRWHGYRAAYRYIVFQALPHTTSLGPEVWRVLDKSHTLRNISEYEGNVEIDNQLLHPER
jgi:hypothetical protein